MIALASFIIAETWGEVKRDRDPDPSSGITTIILIVAFAWFDLRMAEILAAAL